jgi:hypothetical protein
LPDPEPPDDPDPEPPELPDDPLPEPLVPEPLETLPEFEPGAVELVVEPEVVELVLGIVEGLVAWGAGVVAGVVAAGGAAALRGTLGDVLDGRAAGVVGADGDEDGVGDDVSGVPG